MPLFRAKPVHVYGDKIVKVEHHLLGHYIITLESGVVRQLSHAECARMTPAEGDYLVRTILPNVYEYLNPKNVFETKYEAVDPNDSPVAAGPVEFPETGLIGGAVGSITPPAAVGLISAARANIAAQSAVASTAVGNINVQGETAGVYVNDVAPVDGVNVIVPDENPDAGYLPAEEVEAVGDEGQECAEDNAGVGGSEEGAANDAPAELGAEIQAAEAIITDEPKDGGAE